MSFISSSEVKKKIMSAEGTNEIYIFFISRDEIKLIFTPKNLNFLQILETYRIEMKWWNRKSISMFSKILYFHM